MGTDAVVVVAQPQPAPSQNPEYVRLLAASQARRPWTYGLLSCCEDTGLCCDAFLCGVCQQARLHDAVLGGKSNSFNCGVCCLLMLGGLCLGELPCCLHRCYLRGALRDHVGVEGSVCGDCVASLCCGGCVVCQGHRELKTHGVDPGTTCCESTTPVTKVVQKGFAPAQQGFVSQQQGLVQEGHEPNYLARVAE